jgi:guanosine-3',5'-bis(diphosphate) 3'-pyrophosphohydrolase
MSTPHDILAAAAFAARAHDGHRRKDGKTPYISHPFRVCLVVRDVFGQDDPRMLITALLHDTIEDTTTDFDDIEERYGAEIARWVAFLTKNKGLPEAEREREYIARLQRAPWQVHICKLADVYDNLTDLKQLPRERQATALERYAHYYGALREVAGPKVKKHLALVGKLIEELRSAVNG